MDHLISIIIPVYNGEKYVKETIDSVIAQTYTHWELLVIDDGSTDHTKQVINDLLSDSRISYTYKDNSGVSETRNKGIDLAKGDFIAFLDADDLWEKDNLMTKLTILDHNQKIDWVFSDSIEIDENSKKIKNANKGKGDHILENILLWNGEVVPGPCSNLLMRRKCLEGGLKFDPQLSTAADQDFCIYLAQQFKGYHIEECLWRYRVLKNSMSRSITLMEKDHIKVYQKALKNGVFKNATFRRKCFSNLYLVIAGSWWVNTDNKGRALLFMMKSIFTYPPNMMKLLRKLV